jgi:phosphoenolpyruvate carboxykinase (GTP)
MPRYQDLDWTGMEGFTEQDFHSSMSIDREEWNAELLAQEELFIKLHDRLPQELRAVRELMLAALWRSPDHWDMNEDPT